MSAHVDAARAIAGGLSLELSAEALEVIAARAAELVLAQLEERAGQGEDRWMGTRDAAAYLGLTPNALHKLTAAREIPFEQEVAGGKCWFLRSELEAWRRGGGR